MRPFVIYSPPFNHASAGVRALHNLRAKLETLGYEAKMGPVAGRPCRDCPQPPPLDPDGVAESIVVLPEILRGNPTPSPYVVRWLLNRPNYNPTCDNRAGPQVPGLTFSYSKTINPNVPRLLVPTIDLDVFHPKTSPGRGTAMYAGKGRKPPGWRPPHGAAIISARQPRSAPLLGDLLRSVDVLISFDPFSAINFEATLCGTPVQMFPNDQWSRAEVEDTEFSLNGYCWPDDDLDEARKQAAGAFDIYRGELEQYDGDVRAFAELAQEHFRKPIRVRRPSVRDVSVIVPYGGGCEHRARAFEWVRARYERLGWEVVIGEGDPERWVKADAVRDGIAKAKGKVKVFVVADGDCWSDGTEPAVSAVLDGAPWAVPHKNVYRLSAAATLSVLAGETPTTQMPLDRPTYKAIPGGGIAVVTREVYEDIPLDPRFVGWGGEDSSWGYALNTFHKAPWRAKTPLWHFWHPPQARAVKGDADPNAALRRRYRDACQRPEQTRALVEEAKCHTTASSSTP